MQFSLARIFTAIAAIAFLLAVPNIKLELPAGVVLTTIILHQVSCASLLGFALWAVLGKRRLIGFSFAFLICVVWLPYSMDLGQLLIWGEPTIVHSVTEGLGISEEYGLVWQYMYGAIDYQMTITRD